MNKEDIEKASKLFDDIKNLTRRLKSKDGDLSINVRTKLGLIEVCEVPSSILTPLIEKKKTELKQMGVEL